MKKLKTSARWRTRLVIGAVPAGFALVLGSVLVGAGPADAVVQTVDCPVWDNVGNAPSGTTDDGVAVYSGGDFTASGTAAESEGLLVAMGGMTVDKQPAGVFNVGVVVGGSEYLPAAGSVMLAVGSDLNVVTGNTLDVAHNVGADVHVGGNVTNPSQVATNGGTLTANMGAAATANWSTFGTQLQADSSSYAAETATGTTSVQGNSVTFTSTSTSDAQYFDIDASQLPAAPELHFVNIPATATVVVNVTGSPATLSPTYYDVNGVRADVLDTKLFAEVASHLAWNFVDATQLTIGGSSQVLGSVFAPHADATISASTNGRVYVGGNITMNGTGNELHNYPFCGPATSTSTGSFRVAKIVDNPSGVAVDPALTFSGTYTCAPGVTRNGLTITGTWSTSAGQEVQIDGIPPGYVCTVTESSPPAVSGGSWGSPAIDPAAGVTISADPQTIGVVTVTNTVTPTEPTPTPTPTPSTSTTPPAPGGSLANTGSDVTPSIVAAVLAALVVVGGAFTFTVSRRKRS
ncbi:hypothetical protein GCM10028798_14780 [Humibacter antri]